MCPPLDPPLLVLPEKLIIILPCHEQGNETYIDKMILDGKHKYILHYGECYRLIKH